MERPAWKKIQIQSPYKPAGDQPKAIETIVSAFKKGEKEHILLGVTGSGKTFTMANVIAELQCPALIIAPNKTLAAQLYIEFKSLFPNNTVGFFVSYYDYYQPEAYVPTTDTYIEKDAMVNDDLDKMRHETTRRLFEEKYPIIISSVSCIYGLGSPATYAKMVIKVEQGQTVGRNDFIKQLIELQYNRNDAMLTRGHFRVRGDLVDILPTHQSEEGVRVEFFGEEIESITIIDALTSKALRQVPALSLYPNSHYIAENKDIRNIIQAILRDLGDRLRELKSQNKLLEYQRLEQKTMLDVETMEQLGYCPGIENYSRYLTGSAPGEPPPCLLDYFLKIS